jgi:hypothetical protein
MTSSEPNNLPLPEVWAPEPCLLRVRAGVPASGVLVMAHPW